MSLKVTILRHIKLILELSKARIAQVVVLSTATGYVLAAGKLSWNMLVPMVGILLLAFGSGALNQYQERRWDALMPRTRNRPIPSGRISPVRALLLSVLLMCAGLAILYFGTNVTATLLGLLTMVWYNGVYTYLKRVSPLAVVPGSLIGALPPLVGWAAAGGNPGSTPALAVGLLFFVWQIPHFWLLLLNFGGDYKQGGFPVLTDLLTRPQLGRVTFVWIVATAALLLMLPLFGVGRSPVIFLMLFAVAVWLIMKSFKLLVPDVKDLSFRMAFHGINLFILSVMLLLTVDRLMAG